MMGDYQFLILFVVSFTLVGLATPIARMIAIKIDFVDRPNSDHKSHSEPIPYLGGLAIMLGILITCYSALITQVEFKEQIWLATSVFGPALLLGIVGLFDDWLSLPPLPRFLVQTVAGVFTAVVLIKTQTVGNPSGNTILDAVLTIVWVVGLSNSINFFDNLDGGAAGAIAIAALGLFLITYENSQTLIAATSITLVAAMLGFLIWNKSPAKIYMGDAGALFLGVLIAALTIRMNPDVDNQLYSFSIPFLLLAVPILDTSVALASRIRRNTSIFQGGKDHLSHRLLREGFSKVRTVIMLWGMSLIFSMTAVFVALSEKGTLPTVVVAVLFWCFLYRRFLRMPDY